VDYRSLRRDPGALAAPDAGVARRRFRPLKRDEYSIGRLFTSQLDRSFKLLFRRLQIKPAALTFFFFIRCPQMKFLSFAFLPSAAAGRPLEAAVLWRFNCVPNSAVPHPWAFEREDSLFPESKILQVDGRM